MAHILIIFLLINCNTKAPVVNQKNVLEKILPPGIIVNNINKEMGIYIGSPSICVLPNGHYLISHDEFGKKTAGYPSITRIFKSKNKGKSWKLINSITDGQSWSNLFLHNNELYLLGVYSSKEKCQIRKSIDNGKTWTKPIDSMNGLLFTEAYHTAPVPVVIHNNRIWRAMETKNKLPNKWPKYYGAMVMSAPVNSNLLLANNWSKTNQLPYDSTYLNGKFEGWLEGNVVVAKDNTIKLIMRVDVAAGVDEYVALIDIDNEGKILKFDPNTGFIKMPGGSKKFTIRYDTLSKRYWSLINYVDSIHKNLVPASIRNTLALSSSEDLKTWKVHKKILENEDIKYHGFQYIDWVVEGKNIVFVSRTAHNDNYGGANSFHDSNYATFHRIENFRDLEKETLK